MSELQTDQNENLLAGNKIDDDHNEREDDDNSSSEDEMNEESEEYDPDIKDDVLRPASTRSKIVVNLDPETGKYVIDPYDRVRMKLLLPREELYKAYEHTITQIENNKNYQPTTRKMPFYYYVPAFVAELVFLLIFFYLFFLIIQLALFNLVIIGIIIVVGQKIYLLVEALRS